MAFLNAKSPTIQQVLLTLTSSLRTFLEPLIAQNFTKIFYFSFDCVCYIGNLLRIYVFVFFLQVKVMLKHLDHVLCIYHQPIHHHVFYLLTIIHN